MINDIKLNDMKLLKCARFFIGMVMLHYTSSLTTNFMA